MFRQLQRFRANKLRIAVRFGVMRLKTLASIGFATMPLVSTA